MEKKKGFLNYVHNFRAIAILFVVASHSTYLVWTNHELQHIIFKSIFINATVLFVFIAGFLFQFLLDRYKFPNYMKKKLMFVVSPYLVCSIPVIIIRILYPHLMRSVDPFIEYNIAMRILAYLATGSHLGPYWFIPMIFIFYCTSGLFWLIDTKNLYKYILPLLIIVSLLVPRAPGPPYASLQAILQMYVHFLSPYVLGMFCSRYIDRILDFVKRHRYIFLFIFVLLSIGGVLFPTGRSAGTILYLQKMTLCLILVYYLHKWDNSFGTKISFLANLSFGVYFIHMYFATLIRFSAKLFNVTTIPGSFLSFVPLFTLTVTLSILATSVIKKIFRTKSRYIIGC